MRPILRNDSPEIIQLCRTCPLDDCQQYSRDCPLQIMVHGEPDRTKELILALLIEKDKHKATRDALRVEIDRIKGLLATAELQEDQRRARNEISRLNRLTRAEQMKIGDLSVRKIAEKMEVDRGIILRIDRDRKNEGK